MDSRTFIIAFEEDLDRLPQQPGVPRGKQTKDSQGRSQESVSIPDYLITEAELSHSYFSATLSTIQPLTDNKSLLILVVNCHPAPGRRFENAIITWRVAQPPSDSPQESITFARPPKIVLIAPQHSVGGWTEEQTRLLWGLSLPVSVNAGPASIGVEPSVERETEKAILHAMAIIGSIRSGGTRTVWTVEENKSSERGIPSHFQLAIVVEHTGPFMIDLDVKAALGGGFFPAHITAKRNHENKLSKTIDVETWKCGEVLWEPGEAGWRKFMAEMTGEVPGVMIEFGQKVVKP